jgi:uncharacterized membrane protein
MPSVPMNDNRELEGYHEDSKADHAMIARHTLLHQGPLPHPAVLKQYDDVVPGAAERIMRMAEQQAQHRQDLEAHVIRTGRCFKAVDLVSSVEDERHQLCGEGP